MTYQYCTAGKLLQEGSTFCHGIEGKKRPDHWRSERDRRCGGNFACRAGSECSRNFLTEQQVRNNLEKRIPVYREGTPENVASLIVELIQNDFITGENVVADGGMSMRMV